MKNQKISKKISPDPEKVRNLIRNTLVFEIWKNNHNSESYGQKSEHDQKIENARPALLQTVITREILIWPKFSKKNVKAHKILHLIGTKNEGVQKSAWFHIGPLLVRTRLNIGNRKKNFAAFWCNQIISDLMKIKNAWNKVFDFRYLNYAF